MITKGNFLLMEKSEFRDWLKQQAITRPIQYLQVHHTYRPNYSTRKNQDPFTCLEGMRNNHVNNNRWNDIGQNFTILENGQIAYSLGRGLNVTPAGIGGANTGALCIEIIGNFDVGGDKMTDRQRESVIHLYACLVEKLKLSINTNTIVYHAWYSASGKRLSDWTPGISSKSCPGTAFFGGNTISAANKNFIPLIKAEYERLTNPVVKDEDQPMTKEEKLKFEELEATVKSLTKQLESLEHSKDVLKNGSQEQSGYIKKVDERVEKLESASSLSSPPSYALESVNYFLNVKDKEGKPVLNTPNGRSKDLYDILTVLYRYLNKNN